jgi:hypothetical protein
VSVSCPVENAISRLKQTCVGERTIGAVRLSAKTIKRSQCALRGDFEDCAKAIRSASIRRPVEISVCALDKRTYGRRSVGAILLLTEIIERG